MAERDSRRRLRVCAESELVPGASIVREVEGLSVGVFNVGGELYALRNHCPHRGGALCRGPVTGTALPTSDRSYLYGREGEIVRCAWHGWEFEIATGRCLVDPRLRAKTYPVEVDAGSIYVVV